MRKTTMGRVGLMGSVAALGLLGSVGTAQAVETKFGEFEIIFDTTVSAGVSVRTADRDLSKLPQVNGGTNVDLRVPYNYSAAGFSTTTTNPFTLTAMNNLAGSFAVPISLAATPNSINRAGSINGDDGRLNFGAGDLIGATFKASHDLQIKWQNYTFFTRWFEFYDPVLNDQNVGDRSSFSDEVTGKVGRDMKLLDLFVSANYDVGGLPLNVRLGKQVISWGEGTFILNGINVINPIDVSAFRRPGAEIKEGLVPVNSIFANIGLPIEGMSLSAFYMLDFSPFRLDAAGTPFSGSDVLDPGNLDPRGSINSFITGGRYSGTFRRNCNEADNPALGQFRSGAYRVAQLVGQAAAYNASIHARCDNAAGTGALATDFTNFQAAIPVGQGELVKNGFHNGLAGGFNAADADESIVTRLGNNRADNMGQYGFRLNYFSDELGAEFGLYAMNYHSRLPFVSFRANAPRVSIGTTAPDSSASGRATLPVGCLYNAATNPAVLLGGAPIAPNGYTTPGNLGSANGDASLYAGGVTERDLFANTRIADPNNYEGTMAALVVAANILGPLQSAQISAAATASGNGFADLNNLAKINCALALVQATSSLGTPLMSDGSETLSAVNDMSIFLDYPEDIKLYGFSFNTTIGGWGVQFETSYRPDAPFQLDTDQLTISSAFTQCAAFTINTSSQSFQLLNTQRQYNCPYNDDLTQTAAQKAAAGQTVGNQILKGYLRNEMFTAQIGTTATWNGSEWWVEAVGADNAVLVTELGVVHVPGVQDTWISRTGTVSSTLVPLTKEQYQNLGCQGSDLPLGGFLALSTALSSACRPTDTSAGYVLLARLTYNNAFNSGFVLTPTLTFSHDFYGSTPLPYGNYLQDRMSASLSVGAELNNNLRLNLGYTDFWGGHLNNNNTDKDFLSMSVAYSF